MADEKKEKPKGGGVDLLSIVGLVLAVGAILGGLTLEGGKIKDVVQITAAIIVLGGTMGAVMVSTPGPLLKGALRRLGGVFHDPLPPVKGLIEEMVAYAAKARKTGLVSLEEDADAATDPFLKK